MLPYDRSYDGADMLPMLLGDDGSDGDGGGGDSGGDSVGGGGARRRTQGSGPAGVGVRDEAASLEARGRREVHHGALFISNKARGSDQEVVMMGPRWKVRWEWWGVAWCGVVWCGVVWCGVV